MSEIFNATTAKKDDYPENILVRKGVSLRKVHAITPLLNEVPLRSKIKSIHN
jgi:hypothetical protein